MKYHPDDQDEIDRLHAEFIAVDEPYNEQVMAFQDASYALGLKRGQAHEAALQQRLNEADQRIDELEGLRKDAERWKFFSSVANELQAFPHAWGLMTPEKMNHMCDEAMNAASLTKDSPEVGS